MEDLEKRANNYMPIVDTKTKHFQSPLNEPLQVEEKSIGNTKVQ